MDTLRKGFSVSNNKFLEKKQDLSKTLDFKQNKTKYTSENSKELTENNLYFDKNNKQMVHYPKNFFKKEAEKKNRTRVSTEGPEWFKVVTDEKNQKFDDIIAKNEETLSVFSRYNKWITVTPKTKNRRRPLEKMKIEKMDETSKIMPNWMQIKAKKDMQLYGMLKSAEYNSIRHVRYLIFFIFFIFFRIGAKYCYIG